jgi:outer membrane biosynthesis protein TonB
MSWDSAMHGSKRSLELQQLRSRTSSSALGDPVYNFRAFVVPVAAANASDPVSYQILVGDLLERAKQYPASALRRGAKGTAKIGFRIDKSGGLETVSLLRSSGQADLDSERVWHWFAGHRRFRRRQLAQNGSLP